MNSEPQPRKDAVKTLASGLTRGAITGGVSYTPGHIPCGLQLGGAAWEEAGAHIPGLLGRLHAHSSAELPGTQLHWAQMDLRVSALSF